MKKKKTPARERGQRAGKWMGSLLAARKTVAPSGGDAGSKTKANETKGHGQKNFLRAESRKMSEPTSAGVGYYTQKVTGWTSDSTLACMVDESSKHEVQEGEPRVGGARPATCRESTCFSAGD